MPVVWRESRSGTGRAAEETGAVTQDGKDYGRGGVDSPGRNWAADTVSNHSTGWETVLWLVD